MKVLKIISYILLGILALGSILDGAVISSLCFILTILFISPLRTKLYEKLNIHLKKGMNIAIGIAVVLIGCFAMPTIENAESVGTEKEATSEWTEVADVETEETEQTEQEKEESQDELEADTLQELSDMAVHFIDVGQGDATLIIADGHAMLIDAGDSAKGTTVQLYLEKQGVTKLDYLILTHPDADHIGGADVIVSKFDIDNIFMSSFTKDSKTYNELISAIDYKDYKWLEPAVGSEYTLGNAKFTIAAPNATYSDADNSSVAILLENGEDSFLFTGDAGEKAEADIVSNGISIDADVYQTGHHGSKTSSSDILLDAAAIEYAVISCAEGNSYGHPHSQTLNSFRSRGIKVFRTDEQGSIVAASSGTGITWNCAPSETWQAGENTESAATSNITGTEEGTTTSAAEVEAPVQEKLPAQEQAPVQEPAPAPEPTPVPEQTPAQVSLTYILNTNTKKFHYASCASVKQMKEENKQESSGSRDEIVAQGYVPCKKCNP